MTPDDFKQKCDEIHRIVCYLDDNNQIPPIQIMSSVWIGHIDIERLLVRDNTTLECAITLIDKRNDLTQEFPDCFKDDNWTIA